MVETKMQKEMAADEVVKKKKAALYYCKQATRFAQENGKKPWDYALIPHEAVKFNRSFNSMMAEYLSSFSDR